MKESWVQPLGGEDPPEKEIAAPSSVLAWRIPWTEEPGRLQSMVLQRVTHDWATKEQQHWMYYTAETGSIPELGRSPGEGNGNPLQCSCLENSMDGGAWRPTVHGVAKSRTRLSDFTFTFTLYSNLKKSYDKTFWKRIYIYIYKMKSLCCATEINNTINQLYFNLKK